MTKVYILKKLGKQEYVAGVVELTGTDVVKFKYVEIEDIDMANFFDSKDEAKEYLKGFKKVDGVVEIKEVWI